MFHFTGVTFMLLELRNITYHYPNMDADVFRGLHLRLARPGFHALFGPSGVGKTTLARILSGGLSGYEGQIRAEGISSVLYSYNLERLPGWSTVATHIAKVTPAGHRPLMAELLDSFGLDSCLASRFSKLSLGQKNRANLTRYLLQDFDLLIMDESLANVDEITKGQIILKIKEIFSNKAFLYISHNLVEIARYCDEIFVLRASHNRPQVLTVTGRNYRHGQSLAKEELEHTMLEILHAS